MTKAELRKAVRARRAGLSVQEQARMSAEICRRLSERDEVKRAETLLCYYPLNGEPDLRAFMAEWLRGGGRLYLPVTDGESMFAAPWRPGEALKRTKLGVMEPLAAAERIAPDVTVMPALAYSPSGVRLGFGGGYYDRFLNEVQTFKLGAVFDEFVFADIPAESWDILADAVLTEKRFFDFTTAGKCDNL